MAVYKYILEPYKGMASRHQCPGCEHNKKTFSLYIDSQNGHPLDSRVGRCSRESNCGYHYTPKEYFRDHPQINHGPGHFPWWPTGQTRDQLPTEAPKPMSFISPDIFKASLQSFESNNLVNFLADRFGAAKSAELVGRYFIGSSKHWEGATVFWQIDVTGRVRGGKVMLYKINSTAKQAKRVKDPFDHITWVHTLLKLPEFNLRQCFFGDHLLNDKSRPVAIVESEKTAIIASAYLTQFIWLASGSLVGLNPFKCRVLFGRNVTLFPDLNGYEKWLAKAKELSSIADFKVSELLEKNATDEERLSGLDIEDYLLRFNLKDFEMNPLEPKPKGPAIENIFQELPFEQTQFYHSLMFDLENVCFTHPLLDKLKKEKPLTDRWKEMYIQIRSGPVKGIRLDHGSWPTKSTLFMANQQKNSA